MGVFVCDNCNCVENTAMGHFWAKDIVVYKEFPMGTALCSECIPPSGIDPTREYEESIGLTRDSFYGKIDQMGVNNTIILESPREWSIGDRLTWQFNGISIYGTVEANIGVLIKIAEPILGFDKQKHGSNTHARIINMTTVKPSYMSLHGGMWHGKWPKTQWDGKRDVMNR
jgi:hypothetical protein